MKTSDIEKDKTYTRGSILKDSARLWVLGRSLEDGLVVGSHCNGQEDFLDDFNNSRNSV